MTATGEFSPGAFLEGLAAAFSARASTPQVAEGAFAFRQAINNAELFDYSPRTLPVVAQLHDRLEPLVAPHHRHLPWVASPRGTDDGTRIALAPLNLMIDLGEVVAGIMITGANEAYPEHQHPPQEIYLVLAGNGMWRYGGHEHYEAIKPGATLYNPPGVTHGVRAGIEPVLAAYVLWPEASAEGEQRDSADHRPSLLLSEAQPSTTGTFLGPRTLPGE